MMDVSELMDMASKAIDDGRSHIRLNIPEPANHNGYRVRLMQSHGPMCNVLSGARGRLNVSVKASTLLKWLVRNRHLIDTTPTEQTK